MEVPARVQIVPRRIIGLRPTMSVIFPNAKDPIATGQRGKPLLLLVCFVVVVF
jgi:hypothetical protein